MSTKTESDVTQILDTAANAFSDAMKAGVKAQEEISRLWSDAVCCGNPLGDFQKRSRLMFDEAVPTAQRQTVELLKLVEQNYRRSVELLKKAVNSEQNGGAIESMQEKLHELWEEAVSVVKQNTEAMSQANVKLLEAWTDLLRKNFESGEAVIKSAAAAAKVAK